MFRFIAIMTIALGISTLVSAEERTKDQVKEELKAARKVYNGLRGGKTNKTMLKKYCSKDADFQELVKKAAETEKEMKAKLIELTKATDEGKKLCEAVEAIIKKRSEALEAKNKSEASTLLKEQRKAAQIVGKYQRKNNLTWKNKEYKPFIKKRNNAKTAAWKKALKLIKASEEEEAKKYITDLDAAYKKVKALRAELKGMKK